MADDEAREEQAAELEALEAIFGDEDFQLLDADGNGCARFQVELSDDDDGGNGLRVRLIFTHTPTYPRESIHVVAHPLSGVSAPGRKQLQTHLEEVASNSIDMPAAFTLCEAARDWMAEHGSGGAGTENSVGGGYKTAGNDDEDDNKFETIESTQTEKVEVVSSKAIGTPVTVESFATWREAFVKLMDEKKSQAQRERERDAGSKLSGREFFESRTVVVSAESASFWESEANQLEA